MEKGELRSQSVLRDVAELNGGHTKEANQIVRNNPHRIPSGYIFHFTNERRMMWSKIKNVFKS